MIVELQAGDEEGGGTREKVVLCSRVLFSLSSTATLLIHVTNISVNATVLGSKPSKGGKGKQGKKEREKEEELDAEEVQEPEEKSES